jgi:hypothetical protein
MEANEKLNQFGEAFIKSVRTRTIEHFEEIIEGKMKSSNAQELHKRLDKFSKEEISFIKKLIENVVDESLFKTLFMFEDGEWTIVEKTVAADCDIEGLDEISDGLSGELFGKKGWLARFH